MSAAAITSAACHDASYSGSAEMQSFFSSHGTTWQWLSDYGGGMSATDKDHRDKSHANSILRSQCVIVTPNTRFQVVTVGGKGTAGSVNGIPARVYGDTTELGFLGVALHLVSTSQWVLSRRRSSSGREPETLTFTSEDLADYVGQAVTVDIVDTFHGKWGWIYARSFLIQGSCQAAALGAEVARFNELMLQERQRAETAEAALEAERVRCSHLDAQVLELTAQLAAAVSAEAGQVAPKRPAAKEAEMHAHTEIGAKEQAALEARIAELETRLKASEAAHKATGSTEERKERVERRAGALGAETSQEDLDLRKRIQELQAQLARSEHASASLKDAASRAADQMQQQAAKIRELERRLGEGEGYVVQAMGSAVRGFSRLVRCMKPQRTADDPATCGERVQLQLDQG
eukprot:gb/GFBE01038994.1/.p1 GENE.gb/GFBE01038994.1/~~gb/GFBE01038994.1/.p1  ORF type:complete len:405 (+),score=72.65 gb/GFBE01038994.1/:1-1215(+)